MSTPITDAAYDAVRSFTNEEQAVDALMEMRETSRKLERENAALNEATRKHVEAYYELLAENNALRKSLGEAFAESDDTVRFHIIRNAVEALKEAQP